MRGWRHALVITSFIQSRCRTREKINRPQTRRRRDNSDELLDKMRVLKDNLVSARGIMDEVVRRERRKRDLAVSTRPQIAFDRVYIVITSTACTHTYMGCAGCGSAHTHDCWGGWCIDAQRRGCTEMQVVVCLYWPVVAVHRD